jgi:hypothetical protein
MPKLALFVYEEERKLPVGDGVRYWSRSLHEDHVSFTPFVSDGSAAGGQDDETRKVVVHYPERERLVRLPIPAWVGAQGNDWSAARVSSVEMFTTEASQAAHTFIEQLMEFT